MYISFFYVTMVWCDDHRAHGSTQHQTVTSITFQPCSTSLWVIWSLMVLNGQTGKEQTVDKTQYAQIALQLSIWNTMHKKCRVLHSKDGRMVYAEY